MEILNMLKAIQLNEYRLTLDGSNIYQYSRLALIVDKSKSYHLVIDGGVLDGRVIEPTNTYLYPKVGEKIEGKKVVVFDYNNINTLINWMELTKQLSTTKETFDSLINFVKQA
jgi:hypothetical protein|nr:MAG TPA: hypothetical protein [Caudoviricetes sp.]